MDGSRERTYWIQVFTPSTWKRFLSSGGRVTGFRQLRWNYIQSLKPSDYLLCYVAGVSKFVGVLEVRGEPYLDTAPIWEEDLFPCRVDVRIVASLALEDAIPIRSLKSLSIFQARSWSLYLISSPRKWKQSDGEAVVQAVVDAQQQGAGNQK